MGRFQHVELDRKHWWTSGFWKRSPKQVVAKRFWWHRIRWYTSTIIPCKKLLNNLSLHFVESLWKGYTGISCVVSTRSSKSSGLYFFSSSFGMVAFQTFFVERDCDWIYENVSSCGFHNIYTCCCCCWWESNGTTSRMMFQTVKCFWLTLLMLTSCCRHEWLLSVHYKFIFQTSGEMCVGSEESILCIHRRGTVLKAGHCTFMQSKPTSIIRYRRYSFNDMFSNIFVD